MTNTNESQFFRGTIFYDGNCSVCIGTTKFFARPLGRGGFSFPMLQSHAARQLALGERELMQQMWLLTGSGDRFGGADAIIWIAGHCWWGWPLARLSRLPIFRNLMHAGYRWFAARRGCRGTNCSVRY